MSDLRVKYDTADTVADMLNWLVDSDPIELRDLALNLLADVETLKRDAASAHAEGVRAGWEQAVKALNDQNRFMRWQIEHLLEHPDDRRLSCELHADYLASLTPTTGEDASNG